MRSFCNYGDLELSRSSELKAKMRRINYEIQATADTRSTNGAVVSALACHQGDPGSNPSGGSLGRMLTMGTDERQESCTDDGYNPERALSTDACKNDGILTSQVEVVPFFYVKDLDSFVQHILRERGLNPYETYVKVGIDDGQGKLKLP